MKTERYLRWWEVRDLAIAIAHWSLALRGERCPDCEPSSASIPTAPFAQQEVTNA